MAIKKVRGSLLIWKSVIDLILSRPKILIPFLILAAVETATLLILTWSPHFPVSKILAPPIRNIWGGIYLHYPFIYELVPRLFYFAKVLVGIFVGSVTTAMAVLAVYRLSKKEVLDLRDVFFSVMRRYVSLLLLSTILFALVHVTMKQPSLLLIKYFRAGHAHLFFVGPKIWLNSLLPVIGFFLAVLLQGLLVYSIPYLIIKEKKFLTALLQGIVLFFKRALRTLWVLVPPMCLYIPISMLRSNSNVLASKFFPEIIVLVLFLGILVGTIIVDSLVTVATTLLFIEVTDEK